MPKLPPWLEGEDDLTSPVPRNLRAYSDNETAYADLHNLERKRWKSGRNGYFLSGVHYTKGDIILIHHGPHAGQGARVEAVNRVDRKLKLEMEGGGQNIDDVVAKWDITVSLFNNTKQRAGVNPRQISLFDPWTKQQRYHTPQPTLELANAIMPDGEHSEDYIARMAKETGETPGEWFECYKKEKEQSKKYTYNAEPEEEEVHLSEEWEDAEEDSEDEDLQSYSTESISVKPTEVLNVSGETTETDTEVMEVDENNVQLSSSTSKRH